MPQVRREGWIITDKEWWEWGSVFQEISTDGVLGKRAFGVFKKLKEFYIV